MEYSYVVKKSQYFLKICDIYKPITPKLLYLVAQQLPQV